MAHLSETTRRAERSDNSPWNWLLVIPLIATLIPPFYNRLQPDLFGIPFFYWYQLAAIAIGRKKLSGPAQPNASPPRLYL